MWLIACPETYHRPGDKEKRPPQATHGHKKGRNRPQEAQRTQIGHRPQARRRTTGHTEGRKARTIAGHMKHTQQSLNFDSTARTRREVDSPHVKRSEQKEELLLTHYNQGKTKYCALYALAMLEGLNPEYIIKIAKKTVSGTRTRYNGRFWQIQQVYDRLGYYFPFNKIPDPDTQRTRDAEPGQFSGKGHIRLQKRQASLSGHQACYKNGIVYDSGDIGPQPAKLYLTQSLKKRYHYIVIKPQ